VKQSGGATPAESSSIRSSPQTPLKDTVPALSMSADPADIPNAPKKRNVKIRSESPVALGTRTRIRKPTTRSQTKKKTRMRSLKDLEHPQETKRISPTSCLLPKTTSDTESQLAAKATTRGSSLLELATAAESEYVNKLYELHEKSAKRLFSHLDDLGQMRAAAMSTNMCGALANERAKLIDVAIASSSRNTDDGKMTTEQWQSIENTWFARQNPELYVAFRP